MVGHGGSSAGSYLADPTSPIPSHCASIVATTTVRVKRPRKPGNIIQYAAEYLFVLATGGDPSLCIYIYTLRKKPLSTR